MIRGGIVVLLVAAVAVAILALTGDPGRASLTWLGWRADMTAATAVLIVFLGSLLATVGWRTLLWILAAPQRAARARAENRRRQAGEALSRGFLAAAAGDGSEARRLASKAAELAVDTPALVRVLAAQAAEAAGDRPAAAGAYQAMLGFPDMRLAGLKGLMDLALAAGDPAAAVGYAEQAYAQTRTARWAWRALLDARLAAADWTAALDLVKSALDRKIVSPIIAERARAALFTALAIQLEDAPEPKLRGQALDHAVEAARLQPGFAPAAAAAARLLARDGKPGRAAAVIEQAWKAAPHPALWIAYRDLRTDETPRERAERLKGLAELNPNHRESRILEVEQALVAGDAALARQAVATLSDEAVSARMAGVFARVAYASGQPDEARVWMARGLTAPHEPDWSDLDPAGRAFAYDAADWARLIAAYAETGALIHPRFERGERTLSELPELPLSYAEAASFLGPDGREAVPYPVEDPGLGDDDLAAAEGPAPRRRSPVRRRLASGRRVAK
ncbi:MAG: heme biosynthesis protein HemY [Phenylobacterium sp.]|nr:MAG: heme biosynthesis protein HemY [Phenylobacterium sp.]